MHAVGSMYTERRFYFFALVLHWIFFVFHEETQFYFLFITCTFKLQIVTFHAIICLGFWHDRIKMHFIFFRAFNIFYNIINNIMYNFSRFSLCNFSYRRKVSTILPLNPGAQVQLKSATWSMQVPSLWQGFDQQSFQSVSQCSPVYPSSQ